jgi:hypothetical protein
VQEKEEEHTIAKEWPLPKIESQGLDSSSSDGIELTPLEFSRLMVGGRNNGSTS